MVDPRQLVQTNTANNGLMNRSSESRQTSAGFLAAGWGDCDHGDRCDCMALARAVGAGADAVDFNYCRRVLQKHWRLKCNHRGRDAAERATPPAPRADSSDPVQAILVANAIEPG
jgi:hypothetical protein